MSHNWGRRSKVIKFACHDSYFNESRQDMDDKQRKYIENRLAAIESRAIWSEDGHLLYEPRLKLRNGVLVPASINKDGYVVVSYNIPGLPPVSTLLARAVFVLRHGDLELSTAWHVSHLCHNRMCIAESHLCYEPGFVNRGRQNCNNEGRCSAGHSGYPDCIFAGDG